MIKLLVPLFLLASLPGQSQRTGSSSSRTPVSVRQATNNLKLQYKDLVIDKQDTVALEVSTGNVPASLSLTVPFPGLITPLCMACYNASSGPKFPVWVKNTGGTVSEPSFVLVQLYYKKDGKSVLIAQNGKSAPAVQAGQTATVTFEKKDFCTQVLKAFTGPYAKQNLSYVQAKVSLVEEIDFSLTEKK